MKTQALLSILTITIIIGTHAQKPTMTLTFTAVNNGQFVPTDSIFIENLTQGGDTTLYAPDNVLVLDYITSIGNIETTGENTFSVSQNYPNPFEGKTEVKLYLPEIEHIKITVRDILGRELANYDKILHQGNHSFAFYPCNEKYYLFTVTGKSKSSTIKMLSTNSNSAFKGKCRIICDEHEANFIDHKSQTEIFDFIFNLGDQLRFIGYANTINEIHGSDVIEDAPQTNTIYEFNISEGIPCPGSPIITYDDQQYKTVLIGDHCWMAKNLNIGTIINASSNQTNNGTIEKYCYNNNPVNCDIYGGLYQWDEMMQYTIIEGSQGICPDDWHLPTDQEFCLLTTLIDPTVDCFNSGGGGSGIDVGQKMKSVIGWNWGGNGINSFGFNAFPAGSYHPSTGSFNSLEFQATFWSSTQYNTAPWAWIRNLTHNSSLVYRYHPIMDLGLSVRCLKIENTSNIPIVETGLVTNITNNSADIEGEIIDLGISDVIQHGHCWSTTQNPTIDNSRTELGPTTVIGTFTSNLTGLDFTTTYYVKAYAINSYGIAYGDEINFETLLGWGTGEPCPGTPTVTYEDQVYNTVFIGSQCWLKENLNVGIMIDGLEEMTENDTIEKYCYNNNPVNCDIYGGLYQWDEMMEYIVIQGVQGICPPNWHMPTDEEWKQLEGAADSQYGYPDLEWDNIGGRGFDTGKNLKSTSGWNYGGNGTNLFNFTGLPGGYRHKDGYFLFLGSYGYFWTSSTYSAGNEWFRDLSYYNDVVYRHYFNPDAYSCRCLQD